MKKKTQSNLFAHLQCDIADVYFKLGWQLCVFVLVLLLLLLL